VRGELPHWQCGACSHQCSLISGTIFKSTKLPLSRWFLAMQLLTQSHKANNFILGDGLFLREVRKVAAEFPDVILEEVIIDAMAARLVRHPVRFDVVLATNFYAGILSDLASELPGSLGLAGSINANETLCAARAQHGSAPDIAGQDVANPTSLMLSAAMWLDWLANRRTDPRIPRAGIALREAVETVLQNPAQRTADLGGPLGTRAFGEVVCAAIYRRHDASSGAVTEPLGRQSQHRNDWTAPGSRALPIPQQENRSLDKARVAAGLLLRHRVFDESNNDHQDDPADPASCHVAQHAATGSRTSNTAEDCTQNLSAQATTDDASDAVANRPQAKVLQQRAANVTAYGAQYQLNDQVHSHSFWLFARTPRDTMVHDEPNLHRADKSLTQGRRC
jgi:hypothetical protein